MTLRLPLLALILTLADLAALAIWVWPVWDAASYQRRLDHWREVEYGDMGVARIDPGFRRVLDELWQTGRIAASEGNVAPGGTGATGNATARLDALRHLIYTCSANDRNDVRPKDIVQVSARFLACLRHKGDGEAPKAGLLCDHRANVMFVFLQYVGIESRLVHIFSSRAWPELNDHSCLEVLNPDTGRWEIQDPYHDIYYVQARTGRRVGVLELVMGDQADFLPCDGTSCGWRIHDLDNKRRDFFQALVYDRTALAERSVCVINTGKFDATKVFHDDRLKDITFPEHLRRWRDPVIIFN